MRIFTFQHRLRFAMEILPANELFQKFQDLARFRRAFNTAVSLEGAIFGGPITMKVDFACNLQQHRRQQHRFVRSRSIVKFSVPNSCTRFGVGCTAHSELGSHGNPVLRRCSSFWCFVGCCFGRRGLNIVEILRRSLKRPERLFAFQYFS